MFASLFATASCWRGNGHSCAGFSSPKIFARSFRFADVLRDENLKARVAAEGVETIVHNRSAVSGAADGDGSLVVSLLEELQCLVFVSEDGVDFRKPIT